MLNIILELTRTISVAHPHLLSPECLCCKPSWRHWTVAALRVTDGYIMNSCKMDDYTAQPYNMDRMLLWCYTTRRVDSRYDIKLSRMLT